jgi:hypothetical protein
VQKLMACVDHCNTTEAGTFSHISHGT